MTKGSDQGGAIARALLWVVGGVVLAVLAFVAVAPEVVGAEPRAVLELIGLVALAGIPGTLLLVAAAIRRKRLGLDEPAAGLGDRIGSPPHPDPTHDEDR